MDDRGENPAQIERRSGAQLSVAASAMRTWCAAFFAVWACVVQGRPSSCLEMVVLHAADMHSRFEETDGRGNECLGRGARCYGGIARMAGAVAAQRRAAAARGLPSLFVVAGDSYQGTAYYSFFKWKPVAEFVGALAPNVTVRSAQH